MSSLPTQWAYQSSANGTGTAQIVIPAGGAGVRRVLEELDASLFAFNGAAAQFGAIQVLDGAVSIWARNIATGLAPANGYDRDGFTWTAPIVGSPATSMTIRFSFAAIANVTQFIGAKGYDV